MGILIVSVCPIRVSLLIPGLGCCWTELEVSRSRGVSYRRSAVTAVRCGEGPGGVAMRTCKNCKGQYDPALNHPRACSFHTAHFGGETKRKFESVYEGGTMNTPNSGKVLQYWHCCGSEDPFGPGCTAAPHCSYDD